MHFNSHAHVERDDSNRKVEQHNHISTHTLTWSVTCFAKGGKTAFIISTHTLTWSVTLVLCVLERVHLFQLTRSRGAWHGVGKTSIIDSIISTHTLTWSVTSCFTGVDNTLRISTHTLTWSVTLENFSKLFHMFISTHTLTWSVTKTRTVNNLIAEISTHTLTWSVTQFKECMTENHMISTHTLTWSVTYKIVTTCSSSVYFNSHAHVERDPFNVALKNSVTHFNSHAHVERDCSRRRK